MAFFLFLLVNAALFIRPAEIVPAMLGWEVYFYAIVACFVMALPDVLRYLTEKSLMSQPITLIVFVLLGIIYVSGVLAGNSAEAWRTSYHFAKILVYFLLFVSLVTTSARLRILLLCILVNCCAVTILAVLRYHNVIELATINPLEDSLQGLYGQDTTIQRLQGTGIFQDPNDLCVLLAAMVPLCLYFLMTDRNLFLRLACLSLLPLFAYAIFLTHSRGGFLAFVSGLGSLFWTRYGWKRTAVIGFIGLPLLLLLFAGRQTDISTSAGTARTRLDLWEDWLMTFRENVLTGKGATIRDDSQDGQGRPLVRTRQLAHNSYLQVFADLGVVGGCLFIGAFLTAVWSLYRLNARDCVQGNFALKQLQPFLLACVVAYCVGMISLSICFIVPTYMMLALAVSYTRMAHRSCLIGPPPLGIDLRLLGSFAAAGVCFLISIYIFVRSFA